jgi:hypothetical protein
MPIILDPFFWNLSKLKRLFLPAARIRFLLSLSAPKKLTITARIFVSIGVCLIFFCATANATDQLDLSTGLKTLLLMTNKIPNPATVAVIYDPADATSKEDAEVIKKNIDDGTGVPNGLKLAAQLVSTADFPKLHDVAVAFLAEGLPPSRLDDISNAAATGGVLTISTDLACVKTSKCVLGVVTKPRVEIYYSPAAAEAAHINFSSAFLMLVKQI